MDGIIFYFIWYMFLFLVLYLFMFIFMYIVPLKKKILESNKGLQFITLKYKLNLTKKRTEKLTKLLVLVNTIILSIPAYLVFVLNIKKIYIVIASFVLFIVLILVSYNLIGKILKKKGW